MPVDKKKKGSKKKAAKAEEPPPVPEISEKEKQLTVQVERLMKENLDLKEKLGILIGALMVAADGEKPALDTGMTSLVDIPVEKMLGLLGDLCTTNRILQDKVNKEDSRVEHLETRITQLNNEVSKLLRLKINMENGLQNIEHCTDLNDAQVRAKILWYEACGTNVYANPGDGSHAAAGAEEGQPVYGQCNILNGLMMAETASPESARRTLSSRPGSTYSGSTGLLSARPNSARSAASSFTPSLAPSHDSSMYSLQFSTPRSKLPGDTHIKDLDGEVKDILIQELSLQKGNGNDWRVFAQRVGIPDRMVEQWIAMRVPMPMKNVLRVWGESPGATVRLLHRHLVSPQLRFMMLAKRITRLYLVD